MKFHFTLLFLACTMFLSAQSVVDFEEFNLPSETILNGEDQSGGFTSGEIFLPNIYDAQFDAWAGWAITNTTDVTTPGFTNNSAITGSGYNGSSHYTISFDGYANNNMILSGEAAGHPVSGMYVTNSTHAYLSMLDGDAFAKKFGGVTGNDPDFFLLTIKAFYNGTESADSVNFYLADFRFADNNEDYIVDEWIWVDLTSLGAADSLSFVLTSSDVGQFGMNTPAYFCVDDVTVHGQMVSTTLINDPDLLRIYPNPTADFIQLSHAADEPMDCFVYNASGRLLHRQKLNQHSEQISLQHLPSGNYIVRLQGEQTYSAKVVVKQ